MLQGSDQQSFSQIRFSFAELLLRSLVTERSRNLVSIFISHVWRIWPKFTVSELSASKCVCSSFCVFVLLGLGYWVFVTCFLWILLYCGKWFLQAWICRRTRFYSHLLELGQFSSKQIELTGWCWGFGRKKTVCDPFWISGNCWCCQIFGNPGWIYKVKWVNSTDLDQRISPAGRKKRQACYTTRFRKQKATTIGCCRCILEIIPRFLEGKALARLNNAGARCFYASMCSSKGPNYVYLWRRSPASVEGCRACRSFSRQICTPSKCRLCNSPGNSGGGGRILVWPRNTQCWDPGSVQSWRV